MRMMLDPTKWKHFWNEDSGQPTTLGRQLLQLESAGYRPVSQDEDLSRSDDWAGFGVLLVPRANPTDPRYLEKYEAYSDADLEQARRLLEFFIRKILEDGTLGPSFMLPGMDSTSDSLQTLNKFLSIEAPHSKLVPTYWPRSPIDNILLGIPALYVSSSGPRPSAASTPPGGAHCARPKRSSCGASSSA